MQSFGQPGDCTGIGVAWHTYCAMEHAGQAAIAAIHSGDLAGLEAILTDQPALIHSRPDGQRSLLHIATDWPGHFPNVAATITALIAHGADVNAAFLGSHSETPLHWAASTDDIEALDALLDQGANIDAKGSVIDGGAAIADAVAFGQWRAARRLVERGATTNLWQAAALGLMDRVERRFSTDPPPDNSEVTNAFWCACHGGQLEAAQYLLPRGADVNWIGYDGLTPLDAASRALAESVGRWLRTVGAKSASELR